VIRAVLTDIEGTTSSIAFVHEVLFPYARERLPAFVREHAGEPDVKAALAEVAAEMGGAPGVDTIAAELAAWIDADRKATPLKALQGMIWEAGYREGAYRGHVYPDAAEGLRRLHRAGLALYVYSSGSEQAQRLLFGHTEHGDLTVLFDGYFDTRVGAKHEAESYRRIAATIGRPAPEILFLSDVQAELDAAREAGMATSWFVRDGTLDSNASHPHVDSFAAVLPERVPG
jgi:enolase-phosphatase E1